MSLNSDDDFYNDDDEEDNDNDNNRDAYEDWLEDCLGSTCPDHEPQMEVQRGEGNDEWLEILETPELFGKYASYGYSIILTELQSRCPHMQHIVRPRTRGVVQVKDIHSPDQTSSNRSYRYYFALPPISSIKWDDGHLAARWSMHPRAIVTMPNATWMPEFPVATPGQIVTRMDGQWGPQEYSLWPQLFAREVIHHTCIPVESLNLPSFHAAPELYESIDLRQWAPDTACGVPELGFLDVEVQQHLFRAVNSCLEWWTAANKGARSGKRGWGENL